MTLWGMCAGVDTAQPMGLPQCAACICAELPLSEEGQSPPVGIWALQTRKAHRGCRGDAGHQTQTQKHNPGCSLSQLKLPERDTYITLMYAAGHAVAGEVKMCLTLCRVGEKMSLGGKVGAGRQHRN